MVEDNSYISQDKSLKSSRQGKQDVNLFPALTDNKRGTPLSISRQPAHGTQISIFAPVSFDEAIDIVECLRSRAATTISLENMKKIDANRLVDFVAGASAALDGDFHKLSEQVYIFCPSNIRITAPGKQVAAPQFTGSFETPGALDFLYPSATNSSPTSTWTN